MMRRLPPGFRFEPTEEELVFEYLKCKVFSSALPASIIPEINGVWNLDPWDIPPGGGGREEEKYLFSKKEAAEEYNNDNDNMGIVGWSRSGYWKARGWEKEIVSNETGVALVGMKKTLDFCTIIGSNRSRSRSSSSSRRKKTKKTGWVMYEYRLLLQPHYSYSNINLENNKWVLCRIFCNKFNDDHIIHRRLHYSISSTNHMNQDQDDHLIISTPLSDDDDSVSSTASSSSTSAATATTTSTILPSCNHPFSPSI